MVGCMESTKWEAKVPGSTSRSSGNMSIKGTSNFRDAKVSKLCHHILIQKNVARFHISMNDRWILPTHSSQSVRQAPVKQRGTGVVGKDKYGCKG